MNLNILPFSPLAFFAKIAIVAKIASLQGATSGIQFKSPEAGYFSPFLPFSPLAFFTKIASLQGATSGIQFKSPEAGYFSPKSPISPKSPFSPKSPASKGPLLASNSNCQRLVIFRQNRQFRQNCHCCQNRQPRRGHFWHPIQIARGWLFFAILAI